jgi:hypothetical protein
MLAERGLQWRQFISGKPLDRYNSLALCLDCEHKAGADGLIVHQHRASAADAVLACQVGTGLAKIVPDAIGKRGTRFNVGTDGFSVEAEFDLHLKLLNGRLL